MTSSHRMIWQVRRNAVLAIFTIYKNFEHLIPDAPELIQNYLEGESVCEHFLFFCRTPSVAAFTGPFLQAQRFHDADRR